MVEANTCTWGWVESNNCKWSELIFFSSLSFFCHSNPNAGLKSSTMHIISEKMPIIARRFSTRRNSNTYNKYKLFPNGTHTSFAKRYWTIAPSYTKAMNIKKKKPPDRLKYSDSHGDTASVNRAVFLSVV